MDSVESMDSMDSMESKVIGDQKVEQKNLSQKVVGMLLDFIATFWDQGKVF